MSMLPMATATMTLIGLALICVLAWVRIGYWQWRAPLAQRARGWRLALLLLAQPLLAGLLYMALFPPTVATRAGRMLVLSAHADSVPTAMRIAAAGETQVALPEAGTISPAERYPDLATALRAHPGTSSISVVGDGLTARDRDGWQPLSLQWSPAPLPVGISALQLPQPLAAGGRFSVTGSIDSPAPATLQLLDPSARVVDQQALPGSGRFQLHGDARNAGRVLFELRMLDAKGERIEQLKVPVQVLRYRQPRVLLLAGAANAEIKYLRRWATDAGVAMQTRIDAGAGAQLGDPPIRIDRDSLRRFDLVIADERAWSQLAAGARSAISAAVADGMGLLLRVGTAVTASQRQPWQALGLPVTGNGAVINNIRLAGDDVAASVDNRAAPAPAADAPMGAAKLPALSARRIRLLADDSVVLLADDNGETLAAWRAHGQGRVALWPLTDSFKLVLAGYGQRHARLWSETLATLARVEPRLASDPLTALAWQGERMALCQLGADARVIGPGGLATPLLIDPATGARRCAAYWPQQAGWHVLMHGQAERAFFVHAASTGTTLQRARLQQATAQLVSLAADNGNAGVGKPQPGQAWPWWLAWVLLAAVSWWWERSQLGRPALQPHP